MIFKYIWNKLFQPIIDPLDFVAIEIIFLAGSIEGSIFQILMHTGIEMVGLHFIEDMITTNIVFVIAMVIGNVIIHYKGRNIFRPFN